MTDITVLQLTRLGWKITTRDSFDRAVEDFQRGFALPGQRALLVDGKAGPKTRAAIALSDARRKQGLGAASEHFSYRDFRCKCGGRYEGCRLIVVNRDLLLGLEDYRRHFAPNGMSIVSGYRCPIRNAKAGGATSSQHLWGAAADVEYAASDRAVARLRRFSGIGRSASTRKVRHMDVRHLSGHNTTGGTPDRPTIWNYAH